jgi:hypothetical protein
MKIRNYKIISHPDQFDVEHAIEHYLKMGWECHGYLTLTCTPTYIIYYTQAMVLKDEEPPYPLLHECDIVKT